MMQELAPRAYGDFLEVRAVDGVNDNQRVAAFHCQLAGSNHRWPFGVVHKLVLATGHACVEVGHRCFHLGSDLHYDGPLPPSCPCISAHAPLKGVDSREEFHSSSSSALGEQFWWLCAVPSPGS